MSKIGDLAEKYYMQKGFCCSESVWLAFAESDGLSDAERDLGNKLSFAFCGGMGNGDFCGALAGGMLVLGRYFGRIPGEERNAEMSQYTKALLEAFNVEFSKLNCRDLKPQEQSLAKTTCKGYVRFVAEKVEELLDKGLGEEEDCG